MGNMKEQNIYVGQICNKRIARLIRKPCGKTQELVLFDVDCRPLKEIKIMCKNKLSREFNIMNEVRQECEMWLHS